MAWLQWPIFFIGLVLQVLLIGSLLRRSAYRDYPVLFAYCLVLILTCAIDAGLVQSTPSLRGAWAHTLYYSDEAARQFFLFLVVLSLIDHAMRNKPYRDRVRALLILGAFAAVTVSIAIHKTAYRPRWATEVTRDLSFGSVFLTLLLWMMLISSGRRDSQLLMLTGALGLQFTGEAIGQSLRQISQHHRWLLNVGNLFLSVSYLIRLYVWWEAFRRPRVIVEPDSDEPGRDADDHPGQAHRTVLEPNG
jgi:hypothetical protein